jgi:hypothetical protein
VALDAFAEGIVRLVVQTIGGFLLDKVFYWPGWFLLRVVTLGRYPPSGSMAHNRAFVALFGFAALVVTAGAYYSATA